MSKKFRKLIRILHRDLGYFIVGLVVAYTVSGVALNHRRAWNPSIKTISSEQLQEPVYVNTDSVDHKYASKLLKPHGYQTEYEDYWYRGGNLYVEFKSGLMIIDLDNGQTEIDIRRKRPLMNQFVFLHRTNSPWWIFFSDVFSVCLLLVAITGLFLIKGKKGFKWRGALLAGVGILIPIILYIIIQKL